MFKKLWLKLWAWWTWGTMDKPSKHVFETKHWRLWVYYPASPVRWERSIRLDYRTGQHPYYGAGYIGGWTIYLAIRCLNGPYYSRRTRRPLIQFGWTDNANCIP